MTNVDRPKFQPFDEYKAVRIYQRNLPHWRQDGATYFLTCRLGDSIPRAILQQWEVEKEAWLRARGIEVGPGRPWYKQLQRLPKAEQWRFHKQFNRVFHLLLDEGRGECFLKDHRCLCEVCNQLQDGDGKAYHLGDFVLMPNHVHLLIVPSPGQKLEQIMKSLKGPTARRCNQILGRTGMFWHADSYDHIVRSLEELLHYREYIADNPKKAAMILPAEALYRAAWIDDWLS